MTRGAPSHTRCMPVLGASDMARSLAFYRDTLGFSTSTWGEPPDFAILQRGHVTIALTFAARPCVSRHWAAYVYVADADALHAELLAHGARIEEARPRGPTIVATSSSMIPTVTWSALGRC